jgi:hypothetical protein
MKWHVIDKFDGMRPLLRQFLPFFFILGRIIEYQFAQSALLVIQFGRIQIRTFSEDITQNFPIIFRRLPKPCLNKRKKWGKSFFHSILILLINVKQYFIKKNICRGSFSIFSFPCLSTAFQEFPLDELNKYFFNLVVFYFGRWKEFSNPFSLFETHFLLSKNIIEKEKNRYKKFKSKLVLFKTKSNP